MISSSASRAAYRAVATPKAISWPWKRTLSVTSTAWVSPNTVGIHARPRSARSAPVSTATTAGWASAALASTERTRAWARGLRRMAPCSMPGSVMSSTYLPSPLIDRAAYLRGMEPSASFIVTGPMIGNTVLRSIGVLGGPQHGPDDVLVTGAPADLPGYRLAHVGGG